MSDAARQAMATADAELSNPETERLLKVAQAAIMLNKSEKAVRRKYRRGELRYVRMAGGEIRIPLSAVLEYRKHHPKQDDAPAS